MTSFKIHPALPEIVYINSVSSGSDDQLEIYFNPEMVTIPEPVPSDIMVGEKFTPTVYDGKVKAFGWWKDAFTGPGDTREIGIWLFSDKSLLVSAVINKNTAELKNGYYTVYLDTPIDILFGVEYVLGNIHKGGDLAIDDDVGSIRKDVNITYLQTYYENTSVFQLPTIETSVGNFGPGTVIYTLGDPRVYI